MRNYVIINGVNSLTIQGLAIKTLPPITKPIQRNLREEIDGRDGDLVTELGYGAYDKTIEIGLFGTFDIDEVIAYFNQKGTITFSNEADKVYYFQALEQVDYAELLKFRTANVVLHCQPFKYPTEETPLEEEYEYVTGTGTDITLDNTEEAEFNEIELQGNTFQQTYTGKNLFNPNATRSQYSGTNESALETGKRISCSSNGAYLYSCYVITNLTNYVGKTIRLKSNIQVSGSNTGNYTLGICASDGTNRTAKVGTATSGETISFSVDSITQGEEYLYVILYGNAGGEASSISSYVDYTNIVLTIDNSDMTFEPYVGGVPSPSPSYPQPVNVVSGDNSINVCGKNLINNALFHNDEGTTISGYTDEYVIATFVGQYRGSHQYYKVKDGIAYTFSVGNISINGVANDTARIELRFIKDGSIVTTLNKNVTRNSSYTFTANTTLYDYVRAGISNGALSGTNTIKFENLQLEVGNQASTYEPYIGETYPLYLGVEDLITNGEVNWNASLHDLNVVSNSLPIGTYTLSTPNIPPTGAFVLYGVDNNNVQETILGNQGWTKAGQTGCTFTSTKIYKKLQIYTNVAVQGNIQLERGTKINRISSTPIEMVSIPNTTYKDLFVRDNEGTWYKRQAIGKYIFDSTWSYSSVNNTFQIPSSAVNEMVRPRYTTDLPMVYCNYLSPVTWASSWATLQSFIAVDTTQAQAKVRMSLPNMSLQDFQTWLTTHEMYMLYPLISPTDIEITNETLIEQLEAIKNAISYKGQTNISQTNNDMPFVLDLSALKENSDHLVIDNIGNIYSKPTLDLEGTGIVDIYLNDTQMFEVDLSEKNEIVIDTEKMEAYNPTDNTLANRQVTGDYSKFKLDSGENDLRFSGDLTKATITRYERWL